MRKLSKTLAALLAVLLLLSFGTVAFANEADGPEAFDDAVIGGSESFEEPDFEKPDDPDSLGSDPEDAESWDEGADENPGDSENTDSADKGPEAPTATDPQGVMALAGEDEDADKDEVECVAQIGEKKYKTLNEAVQEAEDGDTIELLGNASTEGLDLTKDLTIQAAEGVEKPTVTFTKYGIALRGKSLTSKSINIVMENIGSTPYAAEWSWMTICASKDASLSLDNAALTMNGAEAGNVHAIYFCSNNKLNLSNGSVLTISNYQQDALEWDDGDGGYNINITDSTFISDHNRSGFTGTFYATIDNGTVQVINSIGNGSNGSNFEIKNNSVVNFNDNGSRGLSAGTLLIDNSVVTANGNDGNGIHTTGTLTIQNGSTVNVENNACSISSRWAIPGAVYVGGVQSVIKDSTVTIQNNSGSGIYQKSDQGFLTIEDSANVTIVKNTAEKLGYGGGIYVNGIVNLASNVVLYNNHAGAAGDDIYSVGTITFGKVGDNWNLDGAPDCEDAIDGWYYDGYYAEGENTIDTRWNTHSEPYIREFTDFTGAVATVAEKLALKAVHALQPNPDVQPDDPSPEWETSKTKTATNLDENYESKVTLSLPAASYKGNLDVAFVLDGSTSADQEELAKQAAALLEELAGMENLNVKASLTVFGGINPILENTELLDISDSENLTYLQTKLEDKSYDKMDGRSGSNLQAGVEAARAKLDTDSEVASADKYMIILSDGAARMWYKNGSSMS